MYCSSCGAPGTPGLSYCNRCGTELAVKGLRSTKSDQPPESLIWAIVSVSVGGLAILIGLMAMLKDVLHFNTGLIVLFSLLSFLLLLGAEGVLIWLMLRSKRYTKKADARIQLATPATKALGVEQVKALPEPALSVTEHTTRTLEPVYRERQSE